MNRTLVILLAVCLISVHAFVKRDAPEAPKNGNALENFNKQLSDTFEGLKDQMSKSLDPEVLKKGFNEMVDSFQKTLSNIKPKEGSA